MSSFNVIPYLRIPWKPHGRDWDGVDCWGLIRLALQHECGVTVPSYTEEYDHPYNVRATAASVHRHTGDLAHRVAPEAAGTFDAVLMRTTREPVHIGIISSPGRMLHMRPEHGVANVFYQSPTTEWSVLGFYRWIAMHNNHQDPLPIVPRRSQSVVR